MQLGKINYVVKDFETTGLPEEDERHRPYQWSWEMIAVDYEYKTVFTYSKRTHWLIHGVPETRVSDYTRKSECYGKYLEARDIQPEKVHNPLAVYEIFVGAVMDLKAQGFEPFQVGANPAFDRKFLDHMQSESEIRHHLKHRLIDTDQIAMHALDLPYPIGLEESIQRLYDKPCFKQKHEADADVFLCTKILTDFVINPLLKPEGKHLQTANS